MTDSEQTTADADITHRRHAIIETAFADLIDGPLAHMPSGRFGANCAWLACAAIAHNLLRAVGMLAGGDHAVARGATLRRDLVNIPARLAAPNADPSCIYRATGPANPLATPVAQRDRRSNRATPRRLTRPTSPDHPASKARPEKHTGKAGTGQQITHAPLRHHQIATSLKPRRHTIQTASTDRG